MVVTVHAGVEIPVIENVNVVHLMPVVIYFIPANISIIGAGRNDQVFVPNEQKVFTIVITMVRGDDNCSLLINQQRSVIVSDPFLDRIITNESLI